ncbi:MAG TPA: hypothetical protein VEJ87_09635 [Acidimicrobiales bacterium]|nr:hypothetical protein [Acidimicrobiales bacterium]
MPIQPTTTRSTNGSTNGATSGNGHVASSNGGAGRRPRRPAGPSTRLALIVLGITGAIFIVGFLVEWLGSGSPPPTAPSVRQASGVGVKAVAGEALLQKITVAGQPPSDVLGAVVVPEGTSVVPGSAVNSGVETYDRSIQLTAPTSQATVISFYKAELRAEGWSSVQQAQPATGNAAGSVEVLGKRGASDGNYWEIGAIVVPTTFSGGSSGAAESTKFTLRLFVVSDES